MLYSFVLCLLANVLIVWQEAACISIFTSDPAVAAFASQRFHTVLLFQALACSYEVPGSYMRGLGYSVTPMLLTIFGTCVLRLGWVYCFTTIDNSFHTLLLIYPISWAATGVAVSAAALVVQRRVFRNMPAPAA